MVIRNKVVRDAKAVLADELTIANDDYQVEVKKAYDKYQEKIKGLNPDKES